MSAANTSSDLPNDTTSQVISAISGNDVDKLERLVASCAESLAILDDEGNNLLLLSIILDKYGIFDYLLSLNYYDLEATNLNGETALLLSLTRFANQGVFLSEHFAVGLVEKSANIHTLCYNNNTFLHLALQRHQFLISQVLIEKGADINAQNNDGCTPLHMLFNMKTDPDGVSEGVGLMIYYGADASIIDNNGNLPFELAVIYDPSIISVHEHLFFYTFDCYSEYKLSSEVLFELLERKSPLFFQLAECVKEVVFVKNVIFSSMMFFKLEPQVLGVMIDKFDYVIRSVFLSKQPIFWYDFQSTSFHNWEMLINSNLACETVEFLGKIRMELLVAKMIEDQIHPREAMNFIFYLLSYGLNVWEKDLDSVYKTYGYCDLFKTLLHMEIRVSFCDIIPRIIYDIKLDLDVFLNDPHNYSLNAFEELLDYFARPKLKNICYKLNVKQFITKAKSLPQVPLLVEFARDAVRKYLIERFSVRRSSQFYTVVRWLPISIYHKKILSFETKLYRYPC
ncbi:uncharacterized protein LOC135123033 [Zophobas morio]|uniref:uncharacterized protein LOC135123033 n=1 Tax=Zophobas morio TaxID=2755281 RepID=UPI003083C5A6